jgi:predicted metal-dependent hydrolase
MKFIYILCFITLILILTYKNVVYNYNYIQKTSKINNENYFVLNNNNSQISVNQLSKIDINIKKLLKNLSTDIFDSDKIKRLVNNYEDTILVELDPKSKYTAYSLNKGEKLKITLRDTNYKLINDLNTTMYIMCHELSHLMTEEEQHPPIFWENMKGLLKNAEDIGIIKNIDYNKYPVKYGSNMINKNPYFMKPGKYPYIN